MRAFVATVTGLDTVGDHVFRQRSYNQEPEMLPSYNVIQGPEATSESLEGEGEDVSAKTDYDLAVVVELRVVGTDMVESDLNEIDAELTAALKADRRLGLSFVFDLAEDATDEPSIDTSGNKPVGLMQKAFTVSYRTSGDDPRQ